MWCGSKLKFIALNQRYTEIMEQISERAVSAELLAMAELDRSMRTGYQTTGEWDDTVDEANTARLKEIVNKNGWPTITMVGTEASLAAWLLVQHTDMEPDFQQKCLGLMKQLPENEVELWNIAFLEDRVRTNTDRLQLYGTQFKVSEGNFGPLPIEDEGHIDERRALMGLETFDEYSRKMREIYES